VFDCCPKKAVSLQLLSPTATTISLFFMGWRSGWFRSITISDEVQKTEASSVGGDATG
jgi:hypothetical protein